MSLNYDCICEIAKHLKDEDHLRFCMLYNIKITAENITNPRCIINNVMTLFDLKVDLLTMVKYINWNSVSKDLKLSKEFIYKFDELSEWSRIFGIDEDNDDMLWEEIVLPQDFPKRCRKEFDNGNAIWFYISVSSISEEFIRSYQYHVDWYAISKYQVLSESFIDEFKDKLNWNIISIHQKFTAEAVEKFKNLINWYAVCRYWVLPEDVIRELRHYVDWNLISGCQVLSEEFIREFRSSVNWIFISRYQKLSEEFIKEFSMRLNWKNLSENSKISQFLISKLRIWRAVYPVIPYVNWVRDSCIFPFRIFKIPVFKKFLKMSTYAVCYFVTRLFDINHRGF